MSFKKPFFSFKYLILLGCFTGAFVLFSCRTYLDGVPLGKRELSPIFLISPDIPEISGRGYIAELSPVFDQAGASIANANVEIWDASDPSSLFTFGSNERTVNTNDVISRYTTYFLQRDSLAIQAGRTYEIRITVGEEVFRSRTVVPVSPAEVSIDRLFLQQATESEQPDGGGDPNAQNWYAQISLKDRKGSSDGYMLLFRTEKVVMINNERTVIHTEAADQGTTLYDLGHDGEVLNIPEMLLFSSTDLKQIRQEIREGFTLSYTVKLVVMTGNHAFHRYMNFYLTQLPGLEDAATPEGFLSVFENEPLQFPRGFDGRNPGVFCGYRLASYDVDISAL